MGHRIQLLPEQLANQIAAGEVIHRPSAVVKELMENALDAGATNINLVLKDAGRTLIQLVDNGAGIAHEDIELAFERHATSKINKVEDIFNIHTKGFRGEALASIAAIAHVSLKTKTEQERIGTHLELAGGKHIKKSTLAWNKGSSFSVKNLFFNVPARRNFLKSEAIEMRHIIEEFQRVALAHPEVSFSLSNNQNELFNLPITTVKQRITHIFGKKYNERLVPLSEEIPLVKINGFVGKPSFARKQRGEQFFFVNQRFVKSPYLHNAVNKAFDGLILQTHFPSYFIYLEIDPKHIDINIHPTKTEIKFDDESVIYAVLKSGIRHALGQFNVIPSIDFEQDPNWQIPILPKDKAIKIPQIDINPNYNPFNRTTPNHVLEKEVSASLDFYKKNYPEKQTIQSTKSLDAESTLPLKGDLKAIPRFFQWQEKYLVTSLSSGIIIVDQHRAHQRVLYDTFLNQEKQGKFAAQKHIFPHVIELNTSQIVLLEAVLPSLKYFGFNFHLEENRLNITASPILFDKTPLDDWFNTLLNDIANNHKLTQNPLEHMAKTLAKTSAVKKGKTLRYEEIEYLLSALLSSSNPNYSPFGLPIMKKISIETLQTFFS